MCLPLSVCLRIPARKVRRPAMFAISSISAVLLLVVSVAANRTVYYTPFAVGDSVTVRAGYLKDHKAVLFYLCREAPPPCKADSSIWVHGATPEGELLYDGLGGCDEKLKCKKTNARKPENWTEFSAGEVVFEVERRPSELAVWLQGHPDKPATIYAEEGSRFLRVSPWFQWFNMPVTFETQNNITKGDKFKD